jgi:hypothetical protein
MDGNGGHETGSERKRLPVFSHIWKIYLKDKCIHRNKHDHIHIYIENIFVIVEVHSGTRGRKEKRMVEHQQYQNT